jgi:hypothetical protein
MALSDIPGYGAYVERKRQNEQAPLAELEQATKVVGLLQHMQQLSMTQKLAGGSMDSMSPDQLDALGQTLLLSGHPSASGVLGIADKKRKLASDAATLKSMQSGPAKTIQPDVQENEQAADQGTPAVAPATVPGAGGIFATLAASDNPQIAAQARMLQAQMDKADSRSIPPSYWQTQQARLAKEQADYAQQRSMRDLTIANRPDRQEPLVSVIGDDGKPIYVPRSQAAGRRPASAAELPPLGGGELASAAAQVASGMPIMQVVPGYGRNVTDRREAVRAEAVNQIKAKNPGMDDAQAGQELANRTIDFAAGRRSVTQLNTMLGATRQAVDQLDFNVKKVTEQMDKLPSSDISPIINAIARGEQKWTGDPAYSALFYYMHAAGMESARILQGGQASVAQLHQGAADEAKKWASANFTTPKAWKEGVAPAMLAEGAYRIKTYESAIAKQRVGGVAAAPAAAPSQGGWSITPVVR